MDAPSTKTLDGILYNLVGAENTALVLLADRNETVEQSVHNLPNAQALRASYLNVRDLLSHDRLVIPMDALGVIRSFLGTES
jgi:large subunit ribosomal protein L4